MLNENWALFTCFFAHLPQGAFRDKVTLKHEQKKNVFGPFDLSPLSLGRGIWNDLIKQTNGNTHSQNKITYKQELEWCYELQLNDLWWPHLFILEFAQCSVATTHTYTLKSRHYKHASLRKSIKAAHEGSWKCDKT